MVRDQHRRHSRPGEGSRDMTEDPIPGLLASALERPSPSPGRGGGEAPPLPAPPGLKRYITFRHLPRRARGGPAGGGGGRGLPASRRQRQHRGRVGTGGLAVAGPPERDGRSSRPWSPTPSTHAKEADADATSTSGSSGDWPSPRRKPTAPRRGRLRTGKGRSRPQGPGRRAPTASSHRPAGRGARAPGGGAADRTGTGAAIPNGCGGSAGGP